MTKARKSAVTLLSLIIYLSKNACFILEHSRHSVFSDVKEDRMSDLNVTMMLSVPKSVWRYHPEVSQYSAQSSLNRIIA